MLAQAFVKDLQLIRSERLAVLETTFPAVHWIVLTLLGSSVLITFLFESDQAT